MKKLLPFIFALFAFNTNAQPTLEDLRTDYLSGKEMPVDYTRYGEGRSGLLGFKERRINREIIEDLIAELGTDTDEKRLLAAQARNAPGRFSQRAAIEALAGALRRQEQVQAINEIIATQIDEMVRFAGRNEHDLQQAADIGERLTIAQKMMFSSDPVYQEIGKALFQSILSDEIPRYYEDIETRVRGRVR